MCPALGRGGDGGGGGVIMGRCWHTEVHLHLAMRIGWEVTYVRGEAMYCGWDSKTA